MREDVKYLRVEMKILFNKNLVDSLFYGLHKAYFVLNIHHKPC